MVSTDMNATLLQLLAVYMLLSTDLRSYFSEFNSISAKTEYPAFMVGIPSFLQHAIQKEIRQTGGFLKNGTSDFENSKKLKNFT